MVNISPQLNINFFEGVKNNSWINIEVPKSDCCREIMSG